MKIQDIINKFDETKFAKEGGSCFECCDYEGMYLDLKSFLHSEIEKLLEEIPLEEKTKNKLCTHEQTWYFVDGYNQAIKELSDWRNNVLQR